MAITNRNLEIGTKLVARYRKQEYACEVVAGEDGKVRYRLADGREFKSPSSAGTAVTGKACNGWAFWSLAAASESEQAEVESYPWAEDAASVAEAIDTHEGEATQMAAAPATTVTDPDALAGLGLTVPTVNHVAQVTQFRRVPNQRGVAEGQVRLFCDSCAKSFTATSTYCGSFSMAKQRRPSFSAAISCVPLPRNGSYTTSPSSVWNSMGRMKSSTGFCVGCMFMLLPC